MIDISGMRFGRLVAVKYVSKGKWLCKCDCGKEVLNTPYSLIHMGVVSCGCYKVDNPLRITHGQSKTPMYKVWLGIKQRCYNKKAKFYHCYGGRGIKMCDRWLGEHGFENFLSDMGERPSPKHSIDRIDVNGDYTPENCRWATQKEQCNNQRKNIRLEHGGISHSIGEWAAIYGISRVKALNRYNHGYSFVDIFCPVNLKRRHLTDDDIRFIRTYKRRYADCKRELGKDFVRETFYNIRNGRSFKDVV